MSDLEKYLQKLHSKHQSREKYKKWAPAAVALALVIFASVFMIINPEFIGFVAKETQATHTEMLALNISDSQNILWTPKNRGGLTSLVVSGKIIGDGFAKLILAANNTEFLILESNELLGKNGIAGITGLVIQEGGAEEETPPEPEVVQEPIVEELPVEEVVNETQPPIEEPVIVPEFVEENTTTEEELIIEENTTTEEIVNKTITQETVTDTNETVKVNDTIIENTTQIINETVIEQNITTEENVSAQENTTEIINETVDTNISIDKNISVEDNQTNATINITTEPEENITTDENITDETVFVFEFTNVCLDTCLLPELDYENYTLKFVLDNATIIIDEVKYIIKTVEEVNETINDTLNETIKPIINETTNISINETENVSLNETLQNITPTNITNETFVNETINVSTLAVLNATEIEINKPVKWKLIVNTSIDNQIMLPKESHNITLNISNVTIKIKDKNLTISQYNLEKNYQIIKKKIKRLKKLKTKKEAKKRDEEIKLLEKEAKDLEKYIINVSIDENITLEFGNASGIVDIEYFTEGPATEEVEISKYKKSITISSDIHYKNIKAYTDIEEARREMINVHWIRSGGKVKIAVNYVDTNNNSLIDRIEWIVPSLSNQTYEVSIEVLNLQSYPTVGGNWVVEFRTTGDANLTITAVNDTYFTADLEHLSLRCGDVELSPAYDGTTVFYQNYSCADIGYHTVKVLTPGKHHQKFEFGNATAYAHNLAGNLPKTINIHGKLAYDNGSLVNESANFTFKLYNVGSGGSALWEENQTITVDEGIYTAILGAATPLTLNFSQPLWLGTEVNSDGEMTPRINLTNMPYAYNSFLAQEAIDVACTDCLDEVQINTSGTFDIEGDLNATNNIILGSQIQDSSQSARIELTSTAIIINLQD